MELYLGVVVVVFLGVSWFLKTKLDSADEQNRSLVSQNMALMVENSKLVATLEAQSVAFKEQKESLKLEMNETMQKLLDAKMQKFDESSMKSLDALLKPFRENIEGFRKKVEDGQKESGERLAALSKEIEQVMKAGINITAEAANLTKALKGEKQTQGRWGEMVLESVLEQSGLVRGTHYFIQENYKDENGKDKRPDVVVKLPQERSIIIDSKVSLVDYDSYIKAQSSEERLVASVAISKAFKNHIDTLHSKDYISYSAGTLQYVFMFVPIEGAYALAVEHDANLYEYAIKKHIVIVYPSTLIVSLKTIYMYWQKERSDMATMAIFQEAGKLYEKIFGFIESFEKVGKQLESVGVSYQRAKTQLYDGTGNILTRAEKLKELGAKTTKNLKMLKLKNADEAGEEDNGDF